MSLRDTDLYDEDTDSIYSDASTFCRHGTFIGTPGGPDLLCGACEDGNDPSPAELRDWISALCVQIENAALAIEGHAVGTPELIEAQMFDGRRMTWTQYMHRHTFDELRGLRSSLATAKRFAKSDDDTGWLYRAHAAALRGDLD
jgi:hypothetical protein